MIYEYYDLHTMGDAETKANNGDKATMNLGWVPKAVKAGDEIDHHTSIETQTHMEQTLHHLPRQCVCSGGTVLGLHSNFFICREAMVMCFVGRPG